MGYHTDFEGEFKLDHPLFSNHKAYLDAFNKTRRMKRDEGKAALLPDPLRLAVGLDVGREGEYFVGSGENYGQDRTPDILDFNGPPMYQPGLWCQWAPTTDGTGIEWDGGEKFYDYVPWINYLISHFLEPWGYILNGSVSWFGEERDDMGRIVIVDNEVTIQRGRVSYN